MADFLHFYEVTIPPVLSNGVAYLRGSLIGDSRVGGQLTTTVIIPTMYLIFQVLGLFLRDKIKLIKAYTYSNTKLALLYIRVVHQTIFCLFLQS